MAARRTTKKVVTPQQAATTAYNTAYEAFVRMAAQAMGKVDGDLLVTAHAISKITVRAAIRAGDLVCPRCEGKGVLAEFAHLAGGRCFRCTVPSKAEAKEVAAAA